MATPTQATPARKRRRLDRAPSRIASETSHSPLGSHEDESRHKHALSDLNVRGDTKDDPIIINSDDEEPNNAHVKALEAIEEERAELRRYKIDLEARIQDHRSCSVPSHPSFQKFDDKDYNEKVEKLLKKFAENREIADKYNRRLLEAVEMELGMLDDKEAAMNQNLVVHKSETDSIRRTKASQESQQTGISQSM